MVRNARAWLGQLNDFVPQLDVDAVERHVNGEVPLTHLPLRRVIEAASAQHDDANRG